MQRQPWAKRVIEFQPSQRRSLAECDRHYLQVHAHWALENLGKDPSLLTYQLDRMRSEWDLNGRFEQRPTLWRAAVLRWRPEAGGAYGDAATMARLARDNRNFARDLRNFDLQETIWFDARVNGLSSAKFYAVLDQPAGVEAEQARAAADALAGALVAPLSETYGARLLLSNRVTTEEVYADGEEPGQLMTGKRVASPRIAMLEVYFDNEHWGRRFFASRAIQDLFADSAFAEGSFRVFGVEETTGHDTRT